MTLPADIEADILNGASSYQNAPPEVRPIMREAMVSTAKRRGIQDAEHVIDEAIERCALTASPLLGRGSGKRPLPVLAEPAFAGLAGDVVRTFRPHTEASDAAILIQFLVGFGSLVGRGVHFMIGATRHHANEFALVVGRSSRARKGDSRNAALAPLRAVDPTWRIRSGLSTGEGLIHHERDPVWRPDKEGENRLIDAGEADKRLLASESEFGRVLAVMSREHNSLSATMRDAWDGLNLGNLSKGSPETATDPHVSVIAHATVADLNQHLSSTDCANGFGNRFIIFYVERARLLPSPPPPDPDAIAQLSGRVCAAFDAAKMRGEMRRTPEAEALWKGVYPTLSREVPGLVGDMLARSEAHAARLSLIYALLDRAAAIDVPHLRSALAAWQFAEQSVGHIFDGRTGNAEADKIVSAMGPGDERTRTELSALFARHAPAVKIDAAIELLLAGGEFDIEKRPGDDGRPAEVLRRLTLVEVEARRGTGDARA